MKVFCGVVTVLLLVIAASAAEPFVHKETGISLPETIAGVTRGEVKKYGFTPAESGVALQYEAEDAVVSVFIRHLGPEAPQSADAIVDESLAVIQQMFSPGTYSNIERLKSSPDSKMPGWSKAAFTAEVEAEPVISIICAAIKGNYVIKLRITASKEFPAQKFLDEMQKIVDEAKVNP